MPFTLGQRCISDTESKLGLGTVVVVDVRVITLQFRATGENRLYAKHHSPITRVIFNPGDTINHYEEWQLKVTEIKQEEGIISYIGTREAYHLSWDEKTPSTEYQAIEQLANNIAGVLLLTATPEQLGQQSHFARLRLLDPDHFHHYPTFIEEQQSYRAIADAVMALLNDEFLAEGTLNLVRQLINEQNIEPLLEEANSNDTNNKVARRKLITLLMDRQAYSYWIKNDGLLVDIRDSRSYGTFNKVY